MLIGVIGAVGFLYRKKKSHFSSGEGIA